MTRKRTRREDVEEIPDPRTEAAAADDSDGDGPKVRKRTGRPPKQKVHVELPDEILRQLALAPLITVSAVAGRVAGVALAYSPEALEGCVKAFKTYASTFDVALTPGWALVASYAVAAGSAQLVAIPPAEPPASAAPAPAAEPPPADPAAAAREVKGVRVVRIDGQSPPDPSAPGSSASAT